MISRRAAPTVVLLALVAADCGFTAGVPTGARLYCSGDGDCPPGDACDRAAHLCVAAGAEPPLIVDVAFDPPFASTGVARLIVTADRALAPDTAPVVELVAGTPPMSFTLEATDGAVQRLLVGVDALAEGLYSVAAITVTSKDGVSHRRVEAPGGAALVVDRTPPSLLNARVTDAPAGGVFADVEPENFIEARFLASEPVDASSAELRVGALTSSNSGGCAAADVVGEIACAIVIGAGAADGVFVPTITARDAAGNAGTATLDAIVVDTSAPSVVADSVTVAVTTGAAPAVAATAVSAVAVSFIASEDVAAAPAVVLDVVAAPFVVASQLGRAFTVRLPDVAGVPPGTYGVSATLVDRFGHAAVVPLALPAPFANGIPFVGGAAECPPAPGTLCVDADGDGSVAGCVDGNDRDDADPTVFPGAIEIPGDGVDNDGFAGDRALDDSVGVFVDSEAGDDAGDGSRAAPVRSLDAAVAILQTAPASPLGPTVILAASATPYGPLAAGTPLAASVLGGRDAASGSWAPTSARSVVVGDITDPVVVDGVDTGGTITINFIFGAIIVRTGAALLDVDDVELVDCDIGDLLVSFAARAINSRIGSATVGFGATLGAHRTRFGSVLLFSHAAATLTSCVVDAGALASGGAGALSLYHSTVLAPPAGFAIDSYTPNNAFTAVASLLARNDVGLVVNTFTPVVLVGNDLQNGGGPVVRADEEPIDIDAVNACAFGGCLRAEQNVSVAPRLATVFHLDAASPLVDAAVNAADFGAPPSVVVDFDGDCRFADAAPDIGADELR